MVPVSSRGGKNICPYCNRVLNKDRKLCPSCGKRPFLTESRMVLLAFSASAFIASILLQPWRGVLFGLSALSFTSSLFLFSRPEPNMADQRKVFLPMAGALFLAIPLLSGSLSTLFLALFGTAFTYFALPALHSPSSEDMSRGIEEFEAQNQLTYGFGTIRDQIHATIAASEGLKQTVLTKDLLPRVDRLLDQKLLSILKRKVSLERILATTDPARLEEDRRRAIDRASLIKSDAVRGELARGAALSRSMLDNYQKISELLNIYNVQIRNLQKVLLNLNMKIATMAFKDDDLGLGPLREPLDAIDEEMEVMERSFKEFDVMFNA